MRRLVCLALVAAGCNASAPDAPIIRLAVDADRDGVVEVGPASADVAFRGEWSAAFGAVFLANVDDDDGKHQVDASDQIVNGDGDALDLARIRVAPWPKAPKGATATVAADAAAAPWVHLFRHNSDGSWKIWSGTDALAQADLVAGVELGLEATDFANPAWDGAARIQLTVLDGAGKPLGSDTARLRVAPLLLQSNLGVPDRAYATVMADPDSPSFIADVQAAADAAKVPLVKIDGSGPPYDDQWTQDIFEVGWTGMPKKGGVQSMFVVIRTPVPTRSAADYTQNVMLAPDFGWVWKHTEPYTPSADAESEDSFGNLDAIPPYKSYSFGRVLIGSTPQRHMDDALRDFLNAQRVQGPNFYIDTTWLTVGHVDEVLSFVKASSPRGWKLLLASPSRARKLLTDLVAQNSANGAARLFADVQQYDARGMLVSGGIPVSTVLADAGLMTDNQVAQAKIDVIRAALQTEIGLADDEIVEMPVLFSNVGGGQYLAYTAGVVNLLHLDGTAAPPKTHGPIIGGKDAFQDDFEKQSATFGLKVSWTEDWNLYHLQDGEVHCGSNVARKVPANPAWWEVTR